MDRRGLGASLAAAGMIIGLLAACTTTNAPGPQASPSAGPVLAITFDDLPEHGPIPAGTTPLAVTQDIVAALRSGGVRQAYGFINAGNAAGGQAADVLAAWRAAGHPLGNHGFTHANLAEVDLGKAEAEIVGNEAVLETAMRGSDWHWFRYPFLSEGKDSARTAALRAMLARRGYKVAAVTMSFDDWAYNAPYARCLAKGDTTAIRALEDRYLAAARADALRARAMSRAAEGRDIPYVLLMHSGAFDARMLPRLLALYRELGFGFVTLEEAEADPFYANSRDLSLPGPSASLARAMAAKGLAVPPPDPALAVPGPDICP